MVTTSQYVQKRRDVQDENLNCLGLKTFSPTDSFAFPLVLDL